MEFAKWFFETEESVQKHRLRGLAIDAGKQTQAIGAIAKAVPSYYTDPIRVASLLKKLVKPAAAAHVEQKLPTQASIRSADLGEILWNAYVYEVTPFNLGLRLCAGRIRATCRCAVKTYRPSTWIRKLAA